MIVVCFCIASPIVDKIIALRNSFVRLSRTGFFQDLKAAMKISYEEKGFMVLEMFREIMDQAGLTWMFDKSQTGEDDEQDRKGH